MYEARALRKKDIFIPIVPSALKGQRLIYNRVRFIFQMWSVNMRLFLFYKKIRVLCDNPLSCSFQISGDIFIFSMFLYVDICIYNHICTYKSYVSSLHIISSITINLICEKHALDSELTMINSHNVLAAYILIYYSNLNVIKYIARDKNYIWTHCTIT